jgi:hypothetical protein
MERAACVCQIELDQRHWTVFTDAWLEYRGLASSSGYRSCRPDVSGDIHTNGIGFWVSSALEAAKVGSLEASFRLDFEDAAPAAPPTLRSFRR